MTLFNFLLANQSFSLQISLRTCPSQQKSPTNRSAGVQSDQNNSQNLPSVEDDESITWIQQLKSFRVFFIYPLYPFHART